MNPNDLNAEQKQQYKAVAQELRCLVCQNQSIADSHAGLAEDLKAKIAEQVSLGKSNTEIKQYMQDRYGEFILYKPALALNNALLWGLPFVVLLVALFGIRRWIKSTQTTSSALLDNKGLQSNQKAAHWADQLYEDEHSR